MDITMGPHQAAICLPLGLEPQAKGDNKPTGAKAYILA